MFYVETKGAGALPCSVSKPTLDEARELAKRLSYTCSETRVWEINTVDPSQYALCARYCQGRNIGV